MNVAIVVRTLRIGGMERVAANLSDAFEKDGHNTTLIYLKNKPIEIKPQNKSTDIRLIDLDKLLFKTGIGILWHIISRILNVIIRKSLFVWKGFFQSKIFLGEIKKIEKNKGKFDLIIIRGQGTFEMIWNLKDDRIVQVCENIFSKENPGIMTSFYSKLLFNGKNAACVSNGVFENFLSYQKKTGIKPKTVTMITNPIDTFDIKIKSEIKLNNIPELPYILGLGRFVPQKNFPLLIKAYKVLIDKYEIKQNLVLVGNGREKDSLINLTKDLSLESRVYFPGATDNPYAWMANSDLFILSSNFEGLGMVIIESFASGTNVVATNSPGGVKDIMSTGSLPDQLSEIEPADLAKVINKTLNKPIPLDDVDTVLNKFLPQNIVDQYLKFCGM
jgi:glycosyltransferase involved in cell wall biosynthesis